MGRSRLQDKYDNEVKAKLQGTFNYKNAHLIPQLKKIVLNMGVKEAVKDKNVMQDHVEEMMMLSGQKPIVTKAKKAISNFKLREEQPIGIKVTIRGKRMYDFLDRFCNIVSPRIRDFRGFKRKGDGMGNYTVGLDDQQVFPELNLDKVKRTQGMDITFVTSAQKDEECLELLAQLGMPFAH
ncbi:MAG: 50S ribosomal protein L5 [Simkaniaceae bacterium]|nr:50S ribosomal protein L5 [Simkaniaceae bacterium]MCF7851882.1 50S ribosomal protein L5 [Simkaniaceae bacterium]